jgi:hypothetical protein
MAEMFEGFKEFVGDVGQTIGGGIDALGDARYKDNAIRTKADEETYLNSIRSIKLMEVQKAYPDMDPSDQAVMAEQAAQADLADRKDTALTLFGELTTPKSLAAGAGILAAILGARESQKRYDEYMASRPSYDASQNPYLANGGGIQSFAKGNEVKPIGEKTLSQMMISNLKDKPMSFLMKSMAAGYAPSDLMDIMSMFGMKEGGGIQGFANGSPEFPRMNGNIEGPGTGTSDSIPAMLSDGEHVLTKQEVSQIGGGNNDLGHQRLYAMREDLRDKAKQNGIGRM